MADSIYFSVVIPCYNCAYTLSSTLNSCLQQTFPPLEVILVDDCSVENIESIYLDFSSLFEENGVALRYYRMAENGGVSKARNFGWDHAKGDYVAFLDADDLWHKDKLYICYSYILSFGGSVWYHSYSSDRDQFFSNLAIAAHASIMPVNNYKVLYRSYFFGLLNNFSQTSCFIVKRVIPERFDERMRFTEDHDLWLRLSSFRPLVFLVGPPLTLLGRPQLSKGGLSASRKKMRLGEIFMYLKFCRKKKYFLFIFPFLVIFSIFKHIRSEFRFFLR